MAMSTEDLLRLTVTALLARTGESQADLAAGVGLSPTQISRKQRGDRSWSLDDCDRLAAHYGMPVLDLLAGPTHAAAMLPADRISSRLSGAQTMLTVASGNSTSTPPATAQTAVPAPAAVATVAPPAAVPAPAPAPAPASAPAVAEPAAPTPAAPDRDETGANLLAEPASCVLCGVLTPYRAQGRPQHLHGFCRAAELTAAPAPAAAAPAATAAAPAEPVTAVQPAPVPVAAVPSRRTRDRATDPGPGVEELVGRIRRNVVEVCEAKGGDVEAARAALIRRAIPDVMQLFDLSRVGARYEHTLFMREVEILQKVSQKGADSIWEARPKWRNDVVFTAVKSGADPLTVYNLDANAAYLAAFKAHLPIGRLEHETTGAYDPKHAGIYLITPAPWHHPELPNPMGARKEPGPVWVTSATLRLLLRLATPKYGLCDAPALHESYASGSTENLLEKLRRALADARADAIDTGDDVTGDYVKAMYSKFVSTIGQSSANRDICRPDWMHIIRSQAFANLWLKAYKAHTAGLTVVRMQGTDELHVTGGEWRNVFPEGRRLSDMKCKETYTLGGK
jgi:hypothetical protein